MNINLLDPGLLQLCGHHFDIDYKVVRQLVSAGHSVRVYSHINADKAIAASLSSMAKTVPLFRQQPYIRPARFDPVAGELLLYQLQTTQLADDLKRVSEADIWLWPSIFAPQLNACAVSGRRVPVAGCVHISCSTDEWPHGRLFWRCSFLNAERTKTPIHIGTIEPEQSYEYLPLTVNGTFPCFPYPMEGNPISQPKQSLNTIGFFGHQRREKWGQDAVRLIEQLVKKGYRILFQDSSGKIKLPSHPSITSLGYVSNLGDLISRCDLTVLPYDPERYKMKSSGILCESLASGIPAIAPYGSAPGRWIERTGAGKLFIGLTAEDIYRTVEAARNDYKSIAAAAFTTSAGWLDHHGIERFVNALCNECKVKGNHHRH